MKWTRAEQVSFAFSGDTCTTLMPFYAGRSLQSKDGRVRLGVYEGGTGCVRACNWVEGVSYIGQP
jgi:hypothetical protein